MIGGRAGVAKSVAAGEIVSGFPHMPHRLWLRVKRLLPQLPGLKKQLSEIEKRVNKLEDKA
jgi:UDP-3-O-[3-hydroxymyristoyl] glucosamine N-acyltransferase